MNEQDDLRLAILDAQIKVLRVVRRTVRPLVDANTDGVILAALTALKHELRLAHDAERAVSA